MGPSIIFKRYANEGETFIRIDPDKSCQKVIGFDANAQYLWAIGQNMPVGAFIRRFSSTRFKQEKQDRNIKTFNWMDYLICKKNQTISHYLNEDSEKRIGPFIVDGFGPSTNTVYEFHGCYFYGHTCQLSENIKNGKWCSVKDVLFKRTQDRKEYIFFNINHRGDVGM